jgi:beta-lactam-binding protein with PASTA domain
VPSVIGRIARRISSPNRATSVFLVGGLLAGVLVATIGAGYTVSRPLLDDGGVYAATTDSVVYVNAESREVEAEARALATGKNPIETVTLADGRVAVVDKKANQVWIIDGATMTPQGEPISPPDTQPKPRPEDKVVVVPAPDSGYVGSGDVVAQIGPDGQQKKPVKLPAKIDGPSVPDAAEGIWVLVEGGKVVHVVRDKVRWAVPADRPIKFLTVADGRPFGVTDKGDLLDVSAQPLRRVDTAPVPHSEAAQVGSAKGAGRWILVVDRAHGQLVAVDARTGTRRTFNDLPRQHRLGQPVQVGDRVYVPDYSEHLLHVRDAGSGQSLSGVEVPGKAAEFALEVQGGRVWANDQFDHRMVVVGADGTSGLVDKGEGSTDTANPDPSQEPAPPEESEDESDPGTPDPPEESPAPRPEPPSTDPGPMVKVPAVEPGSDVDEACGRIRAARLVCEPVSVGTGGRMNTVVADNPTAPPAGTPVPESSRIQIRHYGPTTVPQVVGQYTDNACELISNANLTCVRQPLPDVAPRPEDLDVVKAQGATGNASTGSDVTVSYHNRALLGDYHNQPGAQACATIKQAYHGIDCKVVEGPTEATSNGVAAGNTFGQDPAPESEVRSAEPGQSGSVVTLTVVKGSAYRVPDVRGQTPENACATLSQQGLGCDARADVMGRARVVLTQEPAPGTPVDGGSVVIHHPPADASALLNSCRRDNGDYVFRLLETCGNEYPNERYEIGWGYPVGTPRSPGMVEPMWEHYCNGTVEKCLGYSSNRYYSRGSEIFHPEWQVRPAQSVANCAEGSSSDGMVRIWRVLYKKNGVFHYSVRHSPTQSHPNLGVPDYAEFLGCVWP